MQENQKMDVQADTKVSPNAPKKSQKVNKTEQINQIIESMEWTEEERAELEAARKKRGVKKHKKPPRTKEEIKARQKELAKIMPFMVRPVVERVKTGILGWEPEPEPEETPACHLRRSVNEYIREKRLIVVARGIPTYRIEFLAERLYDAGVRILDVPTRFKAPECDDYVLRKYRAMCRLLFKKQKHMCIGSGDLMDFDRINDNFFEQTHFMSTCHAEDAYIRYVGETLNTAVIAGAYTPTEVKRVYTCGADFVKLFPLNTAGPAYLGAIHRVMPHIPLIASGGVTPENVKEYFRQGAEAVSVSSAILNPEMVCNQQFDKIADNVKRMIEAIEEAKPVIQERLEAEEFIKDR